MISINKAFKNIISFVFYLLIWYLIANRINKELILPSPINVFNSLLNLIKDKEFYLISLMSLFRILLGYFLGVLFAIFLSFLTNFFDFFDSLLSPLLRIIRATPVASFIILALIWMGKNFVPTLISMCMVTPIIWENISREFKSVDKDLLEMAKAYKLNRFRIIKNIYIPSIYPAFLSASLSAMGLAWKSGIAAEVLAQPNRAIGSNLYYSKIYLETSNLFAWTIVVVLLSLIIEKLIAYIIERKITHDN